MPTEWTKGMNPEQKEAVLHFDSPLLIVAGAGSGKTRVITHKIAYLVGEKQFSPRSILGVTFTNKAASEMKQRIQELTGIDSREFSISTFHSLGLRILRENGDAGDFGGDWKVMDDGEQRKAIERLLKSHASHYTSDQRDQLRRRMNSAKMNSLYPNNPDLLEDRGFSPEEIHIFRQYWQFQLENQAWDYEDLVSLPVKLLQGNPDLLTHYRSRFQYVVVDEFQDTNPNQYELIRLLAGEHQAITVVGDDDQAIYSWRGANVRFLSDFEQDFPGTRVIKLEQNFRSTRPILNFANSIIRMNRQRRGKSMWTEHTEGAPVHILHSVSKEDEARKAADLVRSWKTRHPERLPIAFLYRINSQSLALETAFTRRQVPFRILKGQRFFDRKEVRDCLAILRLAVNRNDNLSFRRMADALPLGIGARTMEQVDEKARANEISLWDALVRFFPGKISVKPFLQRLSVTEPKPASGGYADLLQSLIKISGYLDVLERRGDDDRILNISELIEFIRRWETTENHSGINELLDRISVDSHDENTHSPVDAYLLTMHNAKGLEFNSVVVTGVNATYLPFFLRKGIDELEEERRLLYVASTRAIRHLILSTGSDRLSPFLTPVPSQLYRFVHSPEEVSASSSPNHPEEESPSQQVEHPVFGPGRVEKRIDEHKFLVDFGDRGQKVIDTSIVPLSPR